MGREGRLVIIEKEGLPEYFSKHVPDKYVQEYADMIIAMAPGGIMSQDFVYDDDTVRGEVELEDALRALARQE
jgi:hypothetical protein